MADEYTPTTQQVREAWAEYRTGTASRRPMHREDFDRWLAAHEAEVRERIAQDIKAEELKIRAYVDFDQHQADCVSQINGLRRAAQIAHGATSG